MDGRTSNGIYPFFFGGKGLGNLGILFGIFLWVGAMKLPVVFLFDLHMAKHIIIHTP